MFFCTISKIKPLCLKSLWNMATTGHCPPTLEAYSSTPFHNSSGTWLLLHLYNTVQILNSLILMGPHSSFLSRNYIFDCNLNTTLHLCSIIAFQTKLNLKCVLLLGFFFFFFFCWVFFFLPHTTRILSFYHEPDFHSIYES